jgi:hypothetical protein
MEHKVVIGNLKERDLLLNVTHIENNIKIDIKEVKCKEVDLNELSPGRIQWTRETIMRFHKM